MSLTYLTVEVLDTRPTFDGIIHGELADFVYETEGFGPSTPWKVTGAVRRQIKLPFIAENLDGIGEFRRFIDRHRGPQRAFWVPFWIAEMELAVESVATNTAVVIKNIGYGAKWAEGNQFRHIALLSRTKIECYAVTNVTPSGGNEFLTLSPAVRTNTAPDTICCPLLFVRLAKQKVIFQYKSALVARVDLEVLELPKEAFSETGQGVTNYGTRPVFLYEFTINGVVTRFANYGTDLFANELDWTAENISHGDLQSSLDFLSSDLEVRVRTGNNAHLALQWIDRFNMQNAELQIFETDADLLTFDDTKPIYAGRIENVSYDEAGLVTMKCSSVFRSSEKEVPRIKIQRVCNHRTYDANCGLVEATFTTTGTISAISDDPPYVEASAFGAKVVSEADGNWFALGKVTVGNEVRMCTGTDGANRLYLNAPFRQASVSEAISATAGDDKRIGTCNQKFNNLPNFLGFPYVPSRNPQFQALETPKSGGGKKG